MFQDDIRTQLAGAATAAAARDSVPGRDPSAPRVAVYGIHGAAPRVLCVDDPALPDLIDTLAQQVFVLAQNEGGAVPYAAVRPVVENLLHAEFVDVVVTILAGGSTIRVADGGPGITDKVRALQPGFTTAGPAERRHISGVGAGLGLAQAALEAVAGHLEIDDNLGRGTVVTLTAPPPAEALPERLPAGLDLNERRLRLLLLVLELGPIGPTRVAPELKASASTVYRDMVWLERNGLVTTDPEGLRTIAPQGMRYLEAVL
jgi:hypothetical protein